MGDMAYFYKINEANALWRLASVLKSAMINKNRGVLLPILLLRIPDL